MAQTYEERRAARQDRLDSRADRLRAEASDAWKRERQLSSAIPMGQPIMVGHHSERRHRSDIAKMRALADKGLAAHRELERVEASGPTTAILASDADAVEQLEAKLAKAKAAHEKMVAANKLVRKKDRAGLVAMFGEATAAQILTPDCFGGIGFASYQLSNSSANIKRMEERLAQLRAAKSAESTEREVSGVRVVEDAEAMRIRLHFPGKPAPATIAELKAHGFRWAPSESAWQRHLNNAGRYAVECVLRKLEG